ncbi:MAG: coproporphyrinogen dehydrogenase HemZ [Ruminococcaceae bacterium]|nr:coproporphyrinogen dehydrogenase HemZ [Oscillospiraceae bacterium]
MKLYFIGHDYKYAAEQMLLTLFPDRRPEYPELPASQGEDALCLSLHKGAVWATATARLVLDGRLYTARRRCRTAELTGGLATDRACQRILKLAFYQAGTQALGSQPPWGALTGVRPVKIPTKAILGGKTEAEAHTLLKQEYFVSPDRAQLAMDCAKASLNLDRSLQPDEVSLYVGIPFCPTRCAYCSFISADTRRSLKLVSPYLDGLLQEVEQAGLGLKEAGKTIRSLYVGGGTPTTLSADQLDLLLTAMEAHLPLSRCAEYTVEAGRPDTITRDKLEVLNRHNIGRISINPQTLENHVLEAIGRQHTAGDIAAANTLAREIGFDCINMDLIAGLPRDSFEGFRRSLEGVLAMAPENITVHTLALKKGSRLMEEKGSIPSGDEVARMLAFSNDTLRAAGYLPYYLYRQKYMSGSLENVGWAKPGRENIYNICMMEELHSVLSLGAGGVTKLVDRNTGAIRRISNPKFPYEYMEQLPQILEQKRKLWVQD